jgi:hypothetical protein
MPLPRILAPKRWQTNKSGSHFVSQEQATATLFSAMYWESVERGTSWMVTAPLGVGLRNKNQRRSLQSMVPVTLEVTGTILGLVLKLAE